MTASSLNITLKQRARSLRGAFRAILRQRKYRPVRGAPPSMPPGLLAQISADLAGSPPQRVEHIHLSAWKDAGAYRLMVRTQSGRRLDMIFKDARYHHEALPGLDGLPYTPGPPEFVLASHAHRYQTRVMPRVYYAEEVTAGEHYRYIFEDLAKSHTRLKGGADTLRVAANLPAFHAALAETYQRVDSNRLLRFDPSSSRRLLAYAERNLAALEQHIDSAALAQVLPLMPEIDRLQALEFDRPVIPPQAIHGDLNYSNVYLHPDGSFRAVDWEWAGFGYPHLDLAVLLKGQPLEVETLAIQTYAGQNDQLSPYDHRRLYFWSLLERSLLDAAYIAAQHLQASGKPIISLPEFINDALRRALRAYRQLSE